MTVLLDWAVPVASTLTAAGAITTATYARQVAREVGANRDRSKTNRRLLIGEPELLDRNLLERLRDLEDRVEK